MSEAEELNMTTNMEVEDLGTVTQDLDAYIEHLYNDFLKSFLYKWACHEVSYLELYNSHRVFWSLDETNGSQQLYNSCGESQSNTNLSVKQKIVIMLCKKTTFNAGVLVQFWAPKMIEGGGCVLTTDDQPFCLSYEYSKGLAAYRMHCCMTEYDVQKGLGLPVRVFSSKLPEWTRDVKHYSMQEYPWFSVAVKCGICTSWATPVIEPLTRTCVGVLESVRTCAESYPPFGPFDSALKEVDLTCLEDCKSVVQLKGVSCVLREVQEGLNLVCKIHQLPFAQCWTTCGPCSGMANGNSYNASLLGNVMCQVYGASCTEYDGDMNSFNFACSTHRLKEGQGVVGRAYRSRASCFCEDVTQFSILDYPLVHHARIAKLTCCFVVCLQSIGSGDNDFVLEFFLPHNGTEAGGSRKLLESIMATVKIHFQSFRLASGQQLGNELSVEIVNSSVGGANYFQICQAIGSPPRDEILGVRRESEKLDLSVQLALDVDSTNYRVGVANTEHSNSTITCSGEKATINSSEGEHETSPDVLDKLSKMRRDDAAKFLGISQSTFKRWCRKKGIKRWPPGKRHNADYLFSQLRDLSESCKIQVEQMPGLSREEHPKRAPVPEEDAKSDKMQSDMVMIIKATYGKYIIRFQLPFTAGMEILWEEIAKRLKLDVGSFDVTYQDEENDWILITCNEDLWDCMNHLRSLGMTTVKLLVQPTAAGLAA